MEMSAEEILERFDRLYGEYGDRASIVVATNDEDAIRLSNERDRYGLVEIIMEKPKVIEGLKGYTARYEDFIDDTYELFSKIGESE
jgi:hypothetical protein